jgi:hypothetical protein
MKRPTGIIRKRAIGRRIMQVESMQQAHQRAIEEAMVDHAVFVSLLVSA